MVMTYTRHVSNLCRSIFLTFNHIIDGGTRQSGGNNQNSVNFKDNFLDFQQFFLVFKFLKDNFLFYIGQIFVKAMAELAMVKAVKVDLFSSVCHNLASLFSLPISLFVCSA
jgi:hypothetical protein